MKKNVIIVGRNIYSQLRLITVDPKGTPDKVGEKLPHWLFSYNGTGFTVREDFYKAYKAGKIAEVSLVLDKRMKDVPKFSEEGEQLEGQFDQVQVDSVQMGGFMLYETLQGIVENEGRLKGIELRTMKEYGITAKDLGLSFTQTAPANETETETSTDAAGAEVAATTEAEEIK